ncbi:hypothetical protein RYX36_033487 [Vicia faba]
MVEANIKKGILKKQNFNIGVSAFSHTLSLLGFQSRRALLVFNSPNFSPAISDQRDYYSREFDSLLLIFDYRLFSYAFDPRLGFMGRVGQIGVYLLCWSDCILSSLLLVLGFKAVLAILGFIVYVGQIGVYWLFWPDP